MPKLTKKYVDTIEPPAAGQRFIRDDELKGFALRVTPGSKTYIVEGRVKGSGTNRRITLGKHGKLTAELARREAKQVLAAMATGHDPVIELAEHKTKQV